MAVLDVDKWSLLNWHRMFACERCGSTIYSVARRRAATAYSDPRANEDMFLCDQCAEAYYAYWAEMWAEYNNSRR